MILGSFVTVAGLLLTIPYRIIIFCVIFAVIISLAKLLNTLLHSRVAHLVERLV